MEMNRDLVSATDAVAEEVGLLWNGAWQVDRAKFVKALNIAYKQGREVSLQRSRQMMDVQATIDMMYRAAVNVQAPDIGDRQELEELIANGDVEANTVVEFFNEYGRLYAESLDLQTAIAKQAEADAIFNTTIAALL